jgi:hypothetical protein
MAQSVKAMMVETGVPQQRNPASIRDVRMALDVALPIREYQIELALLRAVQSPAAQECDQR